MRSDRLRTLAALSYKDPRAVLLDMRQLERQIAATDIDARVRHLRANDLRKVRELREACLFCYGMSRCMRIDIRVAHAEAQDYDAVATWVREDIQSFAPIQLKEIVPTELTTRGSAQDVIDSLARYVDSPELTVAIHLNRVTRFTPTELVIPPLKLAALWIFGAVSPDQSKWAIWGNFLGDLESSEFVYPTDS
jgi:hypothetical protein